MKKSVVPSTAIAFLIHKLNGFYSCRMFENRVPHMLDNDYTPYSALDIFVKDLVRLATLVSL